MMTSPDPVPQSKFDALVTRLPLMWFSLAFVGGILIASRVTLSTLIWLGIAGVAVLLALVMVVFFFHSPAQPLRLSTTTWFLLALCLGFLALGAARYQAWQPKPDEHAIAWYNDQPEELLVSGTIAAPPDVRESYTSLRLQVSAVDAGDGDVAVEGLLLVRVDDDETYQYGESVRLRGLLVTPPEDEEFSYRDYLARQGIRAFMPIGQVTRLPFAVAGNPILRWIYAFKEQALTNLYALLPDPEASLLAGILLGNERGLTLETQQAFRNTGTAHIIAISGFNMALLAALLVSLFCRLLGARRGVWVAIAGIVLYTFLVGAEASVVRAAIMGGLALFARQVGRRQTALNTLAFTAALMCIWNPNVPWDVGFQLSFAATLGLVLYVEPLQQWASQIIGRHVHASAVQKIARQLSEYVLFTLAAQITTLPIMAWHFGRISLIALLANPFILPVQPPVMILGGLALLASLIYMPVGRLIAWVAWPFTAYTIRTVEFFDRWLHGYIPLGEFSFLFVLLFYALLLLVTFGRGRLRKILGAVATPAVILAGLAVATILTWSAAFSAHDGRLHLTFLNVGSADGVLITTPGGRSLLINGGASATTLSDSLGRRISPLHRSLDWLIVASPLEEQVAALPAVLERYPVENVLWSGTFQASYSAGRLDEWLTNNSVPVTRAETGFTLDLGYGGRLEVLSATVRGAVLLVEWGQFRALLPIGMNFEALEMLQNGPNLAAVDVLLLADSGFAALNEAAWLTELSPQVFILSVAADDAFGLPDESVLASTTNRTLLRTDQNGWVEVTTDGQDFWLTVERK